MDQLNNHDYYVSRAIASRQLAERAASPSIAAIHAEFANRYESTAAQMEAKTPLIFSRD